MTLFELTLKSSSGPLVSDYDAGILDLDGVVYVGDRALAGVPETLAAARKLGMTLAFVTNNAARTPDEVARHLGELGVAAAPRDVVTSAQAAAREVAARVEPGSKVLVVGGEGLEVALREHDLIPVASAQDAPAAVVQGFHPSVGWSLLAEGAYAVGAGAVWVASNLDLTVPTARGVAPGNGTLVRAIAAVVGADPDVVAGKPYRPLLDETVRRISAQRPLVVGDRLDTDIAGAVTWGADSLLVMTGVTDLGGLCRAGPGQRPTYVSWSLSGLLASHEAPVRAEDGWRTGDWEIEVVDGRAEVRARGTDHDAGLGAAAAACWAWLDEHTSHEDNHAGRDRDDSSSARLDVDALDRLWSSR